jgi:ABC-type arginine/histidine transport system permease subunit
MAGPARYGRRRKRVDPWKLLQTLLSGIFMTIAIFLILTAIGELIVLLIDSRSSGPGTYQDWWSTPLMMVIASLPFFLGYFLINLSRFKFYRKLTESIRVPAAFRNPDELEDLEID